MAVGNHSLPTDIIRTCDDGFLYCVASWASNVTMGFFWFAALFAFCIVIFMAVSRFGNVRAFGFASWTGMIGGVWLAVLRLIPWWMGSTFIIIGIIGTAIMIISKR